MNTSLRLQERALVWSREALPSPAHGSVPGRPTPVLSAESRKKLDGFDAFWPQSGLTSLSFLADRMPALLPTRLKPDRYPDLSDRFELLARPNGYFVTAADLMAARTAGGLRALFAHLPLDPVWLAVQDPDGMIAQKAVELGVPEILQTMVRGDRIYLQRCNEAGRHSGPLRAAVRMGSVDLVRFLLHLGAAPARDDLLAARPNPALHELLRIHYERLPPHQRH